MRTSGPATRRRGASAQRERQRGLARERAEPPGAFPWGSGSRTARCRGSDRSDPERMRPAQARRRACFKAPSPPPSASARFSPIPPLALHGSCGDRHAQLDGTFRRVAGDAWLRNSRQAATRRAGQHELPPPTVDQVPSSCCLRLAITRRGTPAGGRPAGAACPVSSGSPSPRTASNVRAHEGLELGYGGGASIRDSARHAALPSGAAWAGRPACPAP